MHSRRGDGIRWDGGDAAEGIAGRERVGGEEGGQGHLPTSTESSEESEEEEEEEEEEEVEEEVDEG
jgi:hypothetical protein